MTVESSGEQKRQRKRAAARNLRILLAVIGACLGLYLALRLDEEKQTNIRKFLSEAREAPFRLLV